MASKFDTSYHGHEIKRGQAVIGRKKLSERSGISEQTIRTCLARLEQTGEIIREATNQFTIITICNYEHYQAKNEQANQQSTNNQPTTNQQLTTLIDIRDKENNNCCDVSARERLENETIFNGLWLNQTSMALHSAQVADIAVEVMNEWELTQVPDEEWTVGHLFNHIRKKLEIRKNQSRPTKAEEKEARRAHIKQKIINSLT